MTLFRRVHQVARVARLSGAGVPPWGRGVAEAHTPPGDGGDPLPEGGVWNELEALSPGLVVAAYDPRYNVALEDGLIASWGDARGDDYAPRLYADAINNRASLQDGVAVLDGVDDGYYSDDPVWADILPAMSDAAVVMISTQRRYRAAQLWTFKDLARSRSAFELDLSTGGSLVTVVWHEGTRAQRVMSSTVGAMQVHYSYRSQLGPDSAEVGAKIGDGAWGINPNVAFALGGADAYGIGYDIMNGGRYASIDVALVMILRRKPTDAEVAIINAAAVDEYGATL